MFAQGTLKIKKVAVGKTNKECVIDENGIVNAPKINTQILFANKLNVSVGDGYCYCSSDTITDAVANIDSWLRTYVAEAPPPVEDFKCTQYKDKIVFNWLEIYDTIAIKTAIVKETLPLQQDYLVRFTECATDTIAEEILIDMGTNSLEVYYETHTKQLENKTSPNTNVKCVEHILKCNTEYNVKILSRNLCIDEKYWNFADITIKTKTIEKSNFNTITEDKFDIDITHENITIKWREPKEIVQEFVATLTGGTVFRPHSNIVNRHGNKFNDWKVQFPIIRKAEYDLQITILYKECASNGDDNIVLKRKINAPQVPTMLTHKSILNELSKQGIHVYDKILEKRRMMFEGDISFTIHFICDPDIISTIKSNAELTVSRTYLDEFKYYVNIVIPQSEKIFSLSIGNGNGNGLFSATYHLLRPITPSISELKLSENEKQLTMLAKGFRFVPYNKRDENVLFVDYYSRSDPRSEYVSILTTSHNVKNINENGSITIDEVAVEYPIMVVRLTNNLWEKKPFTIIENGNQKQLKQFYLAHNSKQYETSLLVPGNKNEDYGVDGFTIEMKYCSNTDIKPQIIAVFDNGVETKLWVDILPNEPINSDSINLMLSDTIDNPFTIVKASFSIYLYPERIVKFIVKGNKVLEFNANVYEL